MCLKHRVRVIDYEGRELALLPTKCGMIVGNIAKDVCCQLGVDPKYVYLIEKVENGKILSVKADSKVDWDQKVIITLDLADNERFVIKRGEPILPKRLRKVTLKQLLVDYKNSKDSLEENVGRLSSAFADFGLKEFWEFWFLVYEPFHGRVAGLCDRKGAQDKTG
uniref:FERM domain-containing protein n=1 Tax=Bursaphelenchus xylophilus TaxID=6326 RepID=A0A1I7RVH2_BURXY